jgi:hypothetical protein
MALAACLGHAQASPTSGLFPAIPAPEANDEVALADYLALLGQIAPAAEEGARTYLAAIRLRCGQTLGLEALRRAVSQGEGDPVLMGLIGAAHQRDIAARDRLIGQIRCGALR